MFLTVLTNGTLKTAAARVRVGPTAGEILLDCTESVVRGGNISCQASAADSGDLVVTGWRFVGSDPRNLVVRTQDTTLTTWEGQLVVDGTVQVTGTVNGEPAAGVAPVSVTPRDWTNKPVNSDHLAPGQGPLPDHPRWFEGELGWSTQVLSNRTDGGYLGTVTDGGPNDQFGYLTEVPYETTTRAYVNITALDDSSDFWFLQEPQDTTIGNVSYCGRPFVTGVIPLIEAHEGTDPSTQPDSHIGIYLRYVLTEAGPRVEALAGAYFNWDLLGAVIHYEASAESWVMDYDARNNLTSTTVPCEFRYFVN